MSKEERFEIFGDKLVKDNEQIPNLLNNYLCCVRLNEFVDKIADLEAQLAEKNKEIEYQESMKILAVKNQNKKAIEQLEKVKEEIDKRPLIVRNCGYGEFEEILLDDVYDVIDNQIKQLN